MSVTLVHKSETNCNFAKNSTTIPNNNLRQSGRQTMVFENQPKIIGKMSIVGQKEGKGPMGQYFDKVLTDDKQGEKCFEKLWGYLVFGSIDRYACIQRVLRVMA